MFLLQEAVKFPVLFFGNIKGNDYLCGQQIKLGTTWRH